MLYQIKAIQTEKNQYRLWFTDLSHDLFIWVSSDDCPRAFQFCYNKPENEHALLWHQHHGFSHHRIDSGESYEGRYKMSPIMLADGDIEPLKIAADFNNISLDIEPKLANFVYKKLLEYAN